MEQSTGRVPLDAKVTYDGLRHRDSRYCAEAGPVRAYGKTKTAALKNLAALILEALTRLDDEPAFARDLDGSLIAAVATPHGVTHWKVTGSEARSIAYTDGPPAKSFGNTWHYTAIPQS